MSTHDEFLKDLMYFFYPCYAWVKKYIENIYKKFILYVLKKYLKNISTTLMKVNCPPKIHYCTAT